jgi:Skp family chaperone for outer membrane proteins
VLKVKKSFLSVAFAACVLAGAFSSLALNVQSAMAQGQGSAPQVVLVDPNFIFKNDPILKANMDQMKTDMEAIQKEMNNRIEALKKHSEILQTLQPGTPDYRAKEEDLVKEKAGIQGDYQLRKKDLALREAKIYFAAYSAIQHEVGEYCKQYGIAMAITFNSEKINSDNPQDVLRAINGPVIYHYPTIDITPIILERIKPRTATQGNAPAGPQGVGGWSR